TSGSFDFLAAGGTDNSSLMVGVDTSTAGAKSGTAAISLVSDGVDTSGLGQTGIAGQTVNVSGDVYRLASASAHSPEPVVLANVHVGETSETSLSMDNTAANDGYSEKLNASMGGATGDATTSGSFDFLAAGGTDNSSLMVGVDTSTAGAKSGTAAISLVSDGYGTSGLGQTGIAGQTVTVSGGVYRLAEATIDNPLDFNFGSVHVGDTLSQEVSISNTAADDTFSEGLKASFGGTSDVRITTSGSPIGLLAAGDTDNTSMVVGVNTTTSGVVDGTATLDFASDGTGTSDLGITGLPSQDLTVTANISATAFNLADPVINNTQPLVFGNFREGGAVAAQALSITNNAPADGYSEGLNADANGTTGGVLTSGFFDLLVAQDTNDTDITVSIDTTTAGDKSGLATIDFESDGEGTSELGVTTLASQDVQVTGQVFRLASASVEPNPIVMHARVGETAEQALSIGNTAATDGYSEELSASTTGTSGDATVSGSVAGLIAAGGEDNNVSVGINTATSGAKSGTVSVGLESDGTNTSGFTSNVDLGGETVNVSGNVWRKAEAQIEPPDIDFGIVHIGDLVAEQYVTATNTAPVVALNDVLQGSIGGASGPFSASGNLGSGLGAGQSDSASMSVGLDTSTAGVFNGSAAIDLFSHNEDMDDLQLAAEEVLLSAQVNNYANPIFDFMGGDGTLTGSGTEYLLDFGTIVYGSGDLLANLGVLNDVLGSVDLVDGSFDTASTDQFIASGFNDFYNLDTGEYYDGLLLSFDSSLGIGNYSGSLLLDPFAHNTSGFSDNMDDILLSITVNVVETGSEPIPEPSTWLLMLLGLVFLVVYGLKKNWSKHSA
ncbi:MAG: choice-of-anchor D domain-containing protein, partial [Gammaproteobacteria bacterium]|nr:choice-of-anchor D domain-containing protein [Gammaproteobacteria bacterium]